MYTGGMIYSVYRRCCARESVISQEAVSPHSAEAMATVKLPRRDSEMLNSRREAFIASCTARAIWAAGVPTVTMAKKPLD